MSTTITFLLTLSSGSPFSVSPPVAVQGQPLPALRRRARGNLLSVSVVVTQ